MRSQPLTCAGTYATDSWREYCQRKSSVTPSPKIGHAVSIGASGSEPSLARANARCLRLVAYLRRYHVVHVSHIECVGGGEDVPKGPM